MQAFFHGWRRKVGCLTLAMACAASGMWIRSRVVHDAVSFGFRHQQQAIFSLQGRLTWWSYDLGSYDMPYQHVGSKTFDPAHLPQIEASLETTRSLFIAQNGLRELTAPYWSLVFPLTLLSAYLILWKPRSIL